MAHLCMSPRHVNVRRHILAFCGALVLPGCALRDGEAGVGGGEGHPRSIRSNDDEALAVLVEQERVVRRSVRLVPSDGLDPVSGLKRYGEFSHGPLRVVALEGEDRTRYSVKRDNENVLPSGMTQEELLQRFPELEEPLSRFFLELRLRAVETNDR